MNAAIETSNLTRDFGSFRAVNQLNLRVEAGRFHGFFARRKPLKLLKLVLHLKHLAEAGCQ